MTLKGRIKRKVGTDIGKCGLFLMRSEPFSDFNKVFYYPVWSSQFVAEADPLRPLFGEDLQGIHHVGTTAIPGVNAKPETEILVVLKEGADFSSYFSKVELPAKAKIKNH